MTEGLAVSLNDGPLNEAEVSSEKPGKSSSLLRIGRTVFWLLVISVSLLVFPASLGWMVAFWLVYATSRFVRGKSIWLPTLIAAIVIVVKGGHQSPAMWILVIALIAPAVSNLARRVLSNCAAESDEKTGLKSRGCLMAFCWLALLIFVFEQNRNASANNVVIRNPDGPVVCIGDSLTSGVNPYGGYPTVLQELIGQPVINLGHEGITSAEGAKRIPEIIKLNPKAVVIELGGHDYLKQIDRDETKKNLEAIIAACKQCGAVPVLMEVPRGAIRDPSFGIERELSAKHDLALIGDGAIRCLVYLSKPAPTRHIFFWASTKSDDGIHANEEGNRLLASRVAQALWRSGIIDSE